MRGCVFQYIYNFLIVKRNSVLNQEISRNLILIKRYQGKRDLGKKRENTGERVRQRERRREREKKRERVGVHVILCKEIRLGPLHLLLLLFCNQNHLVILIILIDCCARSICRSIPRHHPERKPSLPCTNLPRRHS